MNKKLVKNRVSRTNTLEAMACSCTCPGCTITNCSGGGSFQAIERSSRLSKDFRDATTYVRF